MERATMPAEAVRAVRAVFRTPRQIVGSLVGAAAGVGAMAWAGLSPAPTTPYNQPIGPHRRFTWVRTSLGDMKAIKNELGGTVNDVVLATVAGALGRHLRRRGERTDGLELTAMVPVSVRSDEQRGDLGNQVAAIMAPLPVWCQEPVARLDVVREAMADLKEGGQALGAEVLTSLSGFAPPTVMGQASRLMSRQRFFNVVVTNVPGPQFPLYLMGREALDPFPMVPLAKNQGLGVAIMSYNGHMNFGLVGDYDVLHDIDDLARDIYDSLAELADAAGVELTTQPPPRRARRDGARSLRAPMRQKVIDTARELGLEVDVRRLPETTATVGDAARAMGCPGGGDRQVTGVRRRRRPGAVHRVGQPPGGPRRSWRRPSTWPRCARPRPTRCARPRASPWGACRPSATTSPWCSTSRCSTTSACTPPAATATACSRWTRAGCWSAPGPRAAPRVAERG